MVFLRGADAAGPLRFELEELSAGRTFTGLGARVVQNGRCCAAGTVLLDVTASEIVRHATAPPEVPGPYECTQFDMAVTGRDLRVADGAYTNDVDAPPGPPSIDCWVRFRQLPDDRALHAGLLAQFAGHMPIAAALRPHEGVGQDQAHRTLSMGINAINVSFHADVRADRWMLYHHLSTFAGDGMTHAECRVFTEDGGLVASFTVDAMVRPFAGGDGKRDERTAL
jgi:acyl-CoA thioesterase